MLVCCGSWWGRCVLFITILGQFDRPLLDVYYGHVCSIWLVWPVWLVHGSYTGQSEWVNGQSTVYTDPQWKLWCDVFRKSLCSSVADTSRLQDKVGAPKEVRQEIPSKLFGPYGLISTDDTFPFDKLSHEVISVKTACRNLYPICTQRSFQPATSQLVTWSCRHTVNSSPVNSSHTRLVTKSTRHKRATKPPSRKFFYLHAGQGAPRNGAQNGRRNCGKRAYNKTQAVPCSSVWLFGFNVTCYGKDD